MFPVLRLAPIDDALDVGNVSRGIRASGDDHCIERLGPPFFENPVRLAQALKAAEREHPGVRLRVLLDFLHAGRI